MVGTKETPMSLASLMDGAAIERFDRALQDVIANTQDPNTSPTAKREITLKVTFKPDDERFLTAFDINCSVKLAGPKPLKSACVIDTGRDGAMEARELANPQQKLFEEKKPKPNSDKVRPLREEEAAHA